MSDPMITARHVGKTYRIWASSAQRLMRPAYTSAAQVLPGPISRRLIKSANAAFRDFDALTDISLEVNRGEAVGIIGRNGSGKSTLLQIIAGTLQPTTGSVTVRGKVAALLELGSGFNPEFTGRENVYLNGALLGLTPKEIDARYDSIAAFADIGEFINEPVKIYSSGMVVRLAFAVCAHVDAEVLIIDEALGVGDARFQLKCARTIDGFLEKGKTLLFVSHDVSAVKRLCRQAILLEKGRMLYQGTANTVVNLYSKLMSHADGAAAIVDDIRRLQSGEALRPATETVSKSATNLTSTPPDEVAVLRTEMAKMERAYAALAEVAAASRKADALLESERQGRRPESGEYAYGGEEGEIVQRSMHGTDGREKLVFTSGEQVEVRAHVRARAPIESPIYALTVKSTQGQEIYGTNTFYIRQPTDPIDAGQEAEVTFRFPLNLVAGEYFISLGWTYYHGDAIKVVHRRYDTLKFSVLGVDRSFGIAHLFASIEVKRLTSAS